MSHLHEATCACPLCYVTECVQPYELCLSLLTEMPQGALKKLPALITERVDVNLQHTTAHVSAVRLIASDSRPKLHLWK